MSVAPDPKANHVYRHLHEGIAGGQFQAGERLPTEEALANKFGFSRSTVAKAMRLLAKEGLVERRRRAGSPRAFSLLLTGDTRWRAQCDDLRLASGLFPREPILIQATTSAALLTAEEQRHCNDDGGTAHRA